MTNTHKLIHQTILHNFSSQIESLNKMLTRLSDFNGEEAQNIIKATMLIDEKTKDDIGKIIILAVGKSLNIGKKVAESLTSTGRKAIALQAEDAQHGSIGLLNPKYDVVIAISNSGSSEQVVKLTKHCKSLGTPIITFCDKPESPLAKLSDVNVLLNQSEESACPLGLAPMVSTTCTLVTLDSITASEMVLKAFTADDFAISHPGGALGRNLLLKTEDVMLAGEDMPVLSKDASILDSLMKISQFKVGFGVFVSEGNKLEGFVAEGDIRRTLESLQDVNSNLYTEGIYSKTPLAVSNTMFAKEALLVAEEGVNGNEVSGLVIVDDCKKVIGVIQTKELRRQLR